MTLAGRYTVEDALKRVGSHRESIWLTNGDDATFAAGVDAALGSGANPIWGAALHYAVAFSRTGWERLVRFGLWPRSPAEGPSAAAALWLNKSGVAMISSAEVVAGRLVARLNVGNPQHVNDCVADVVMKLHGRGTFDV